VTTSKKPTTSRVSKKAGATAAKTPRKPARRGAPAKQRSADAANGVPAFEATAVGRVAARIQIENVELVHAHFERSDDGPLPVAAAAAFVPEIGIDFEWQLDERAEQLGCLFRFGAYRDEGEEQPYRLFAHFRLLYSVADPATLDDDDIHQFVAWNAMFNAWPYWREYLSSTVNRAGFPRVTLPVMRVPRETSGGSGS
jgi:preprotein translocase subunit SecB